MSVGLLLVAHEGVAESLLAAACSICGDYEGEVRLIPVPHDSQPDDLIANIEAAIKQLDNGNGVLVLSDIYGGTPSNLATHCYRPGKVAVVVGMNLPMLVRIFNYSSRCLEELVKIARRGGRDGVFVYPPTIKGNGHAK